MLHLNLKSVAIISKNASKYVNAIRYLEKILTDKGIEVLFDIDMSLTLDAKGYSFDEIAKKTKFIISVGGDGNYISTCRKFAHTNAFVCGVHTGHLGFLTDVTLDKFSEFFDEFLSGNYKVEQPFMLEARFVRNKKIKKKVAFNDIVLIRKKINLTAHIDAYLQDKHFNSYFGDGVIISSAVGSTAYNMSAGGAIIYPLCDVFSVTPICSHSLTQRPLILPKEFKICFKSSDDVVVLIDGQDGISLLDYEYVEVGISDIRVNLVRRVCRDYFEVLKEKLRWGHSDK